MLVFAGLEGDSAPDRAAKLKALQAYYKESSPRPLNMLGPTDMATSNGNRGKKLVVNSHGNREVFAGFDAESFFAQLESKGFAEGSFDAVYLMACLVGEQAQDGSIYDGFARDLFSVFRSNGITAKVYAPRGLLTYTIKQVTKDGQQYPEVVDMYIETPERRYPLSEGVLLVHV